MSITEVISNPRVRQWLPGILNSVMLLLLTASLAQWTWLFVKPPLPPLIVAPGPAATTANSFSLQSLLTAHLFGQASQELSGRRLDNLPISSLNLILAGVIASGTGGYALISVNGQSQEPFAVGQSVTGNAVLQAVYSDRVVIRRNGTLESLLLEGADNSQPPAEVATPNVNLPVASSGEVVHETAPNHYTVARDQLAAQIRTPNFLKQATLIPAAGGGFLVRQMQPGSLYEQLGLRPGDVIKSVNGQTLNTAEDALKLYQQISSISSVNVEIMRSGKSDSLVYQLTQN
ncbi:MAG: PDZ domain-containing protein [Gammaproteobacteria bacterium]|nr:PDZ domain-containing protein [Gammaproteobacteria bacterium]MDH5512104.1 PDZ domain-containing protein [Gammaproteobacteria bacterium]